MENRDVILLDMLSLIHEEMDLDAIEERFVNIVSEIFSFDRVGLFFVKHRKNVLKGKLCRGFAPGDISSLEIPVAADSMFTRPLISGIPLWGERLAPDPFTERLGLTYEEYTLEILERGRHLQIEDVERIAQIKRARASRNSR